MRKIVWNHIQTFHPKDYICGYCGRDISSEKGYHATVSETGEGTKTLYIYICHACNKPTFFDEDNKKTPGSVFGKTVNNITDNDVLKIYDEARNCMQLNCYSASVMLCRKLLMHIAVAKGAAVGLKFKEYVEYLIKQYMSQNASWVDKIRDEGNEVNHEIKLSTEEEAKTIISLTEILLTILYEFPSKI